MSVSIASLFQSVPDLERSSSSAALFKKVLQSASSPTSVGASSTVTGVNPPPTAAPSPTSLNLAQNTVIPATGIKVADIAISNAAANAVITPGGADATPFQVRGTELWYVGGPFNFAAKPSYSVTIGFGGPSVGASLSASATFTLNVANPAYALSSLKTMIAASSPAGTPVKIATVTGVSIGAITRGLRVVGDDADKFYFTGTALYYDGTAIDYAAMAASGYKFNYRIEYFTKSTGATIWAVDQTLAVNRAPTISLSRTSASIAENASIPTGGLELATISILDDAVGTETITVTDTTNFKVSSGRLYFIGKLNY